MACIAVRGNSSSSRRHLLNWAKLTILLGVGLLLFRNGHLLSHPHHEFDDEQAVVISRSTSPTLLDSELRHLYPNEENRGIFSRMFILLADSWRGSSNKEPLCEFKGDEVLPKHVLLAKFAECYKIIRSKSTQNGGDDEPEGINYISNRRLLRSSDDDHEPHTGSRASATASTDLLADATAFTNRIAQDNNVEAAFHIDYSGPKTHPPKNN